MITKLLDSQSFSKGWKTAVRQTLCALESKIRSCNIICGPRLGSISSWLIRRISPQALRKYYIGYLELRFATCNNVKSVVA